MNWMHLRLTSSQVGTFSKAKAFAESNNLIRRKKCKRTLGQQHWWWEDVLEIKHIMSIKYMAFSFSFNPTKNVKP